MFKDPVREKLKSRDVPHLKRVPFHMASVIKDEAGRMGSDLLQTVRSHD